MSNRKTGWMWLGLVGLLLLAAYLVPRWHEESMAKVEPAPPPVPTETVTDPWRYDPQQATATGGLASARTSVKFGNRGGWAYRRFELTCAASGDGHVARFLAAPAVPDQSGMTLTLEVDGDSVYAGTTRMSPSGKWNLRLPAGGASRIAGGSAAVLRLTNADGVELASSPFSLEGSAASMGGSNHSLRDCNMTVIAAENMRRDASIKRQAARRSAERSDMCTNGAKFHKLMGTWYLDMGGGRGSLPVDVVAPDDKNKIKRELERIGAGDPVLYRDIYGVCP